MNTKILKYILLDLLRSKFIISYTLFLFLMSMSVIYIGHDSSKAAVSILNIILFVVPLVCIIFGTIHFYNSREFIEFLLTQPVARKSIFWSEYLGISGSLSAAFIIGAGVPVISAGINITGVYLLVTGTMLTFIFVSLAFLSSTINNDKVRGVGLSIILWLYLSVIFDGFVMMIFYMFRDYPLDKYIVALTSLNPVDLSRILILLQIDISALMGFTGATFQKFFGSITGKFISLMLLLLWIVIPAFISLRIFNRKNF
ncbi:MAG: ABC transporter permease subunit [Ignavibacteria bacterium]|nr:ABC transporter permease subunit [Ignavibacteria bacterium]MBK7256096.1 ABC transporter permease subunit [Ignavibacteria bacterium]MBK7444681.1 ABC transporter permease subunit [Ignavibacteria bacterium]MBK8382168.1 ABC transporter permease subunit [Ignavibacteria bacterium]MBK9403668.1 ABC transporter permease subunit [Ignavibacteria bacterium]